MKPPPSGNFVAVPLPEPQTTRCRCFGVVDLGTVDNTFPGQEPVRDRKLIIFWELPDLLAVFDDKKGPQPFIISEEYKYSTHPEANFSKLILAWRNEAFTEEEKKTFDPQIMINKVGLISFQHKRKKRFYNVNIASVTSENTNIVLNGISSLPKSMKEGIPAMMNEPLRWDWDDITENKLPFNKEKFSKLYKWVRTKIYTSDEFKSCPTAVNIDSNSPQAAQPVQPQQPVIPDKTSDDEW